MDTGPSFGLWLKKRRRALDLTQDTLARRVGCSPATIRKIEADERRPSRQVAELLADVLEIAPADRATFVRVSRGERRTDWLPAVAPLDAPSPTRATHLPMPPTPLIGREPELAALARLLSDPECRLLTVIGPGGIGKTRLAIEAASIQRERFTEGVYFVPLASLSSSEFIVPAIAEALGFAFFGPNEPKAQLLNYLRAAKRRMLIVLDNLEHLLDGAGLLAEILQRAPGVKLLTTSRERLNLQGEWAFDLHGLPVPPDTPTTKIEAYSAVVLFVRAAQRVRLDFDLSEQNRGEVARLCRLVDGMPLGIELAAAWTHVLSCREIAEEVERGLDFLATGQRDVPERHRSLRAVFDHSWKLLTEAEQRVLIRLAVFRGGFSREAAEQVAGASLAILSSLVSKSLVQRTEAGRYDLHELIRQHAAAHLEADPAAGAAARQKHYAFYLALAEAADPQLRGSGQLEWLSRLEQEHDNLRAALEWSLAGDSETSGGQGDSALRLAGALRWFWQIRSYFHEGRGWLTKALRQSPERPATAPSLPALTSLEGTGRLGNLRARACALEGLALLTNSLGNHGAAYGLAEQSVAICRELGDTQGLADALMVVGQTLRWQGEATLGHARLEEALALYREVGDRWNVARSLFSLGTYLADFGGDVAGRAMLEESSAILEELGDKFLFVSVLVSRGIIALISGDYPCARVHFDRSLAIAREIGDPWGMADALTNIGCVLRIQGDYAAARSHFEEALRIYQEGGRGIWCTDPLCALAENDIVQGNLSAARSHLQDASASAETSENKWLQTLVGYFLGLLAYYEGDMEHAAALLAKAMAIAQGSQYKPDLARSLVTLGRVMHARGEAARAAALLGEGLGLFREIDSKLGIATALEGFAGLVVPEDAERAARLFGAAEAIRAAIGAPLPPVDRPAYERDVAAARVQLGEAAFADEWAEGQAMPLAQAVSHGLAYT